MKADPCGRHSTGAKVCEGVIFRASKIGRYRLSVTSYRLPDIGYRTSAIGYRISYTSFRMVWDIGYRISDIGSWLCICHRLDVRYHRVEYSRSHREKRTRREPSRTNQDIADNDNHNKNRGTRGTSETSTEKKQQNCGLRQETKPTTFTKQKNDCAQQQRRTKKKKSVLGYGVID